MSIDTLLLLLTFIFVSLIEFVTLIIIMILISRDTTKIPEIISRIISLDQIIGTLTSDIATELNSSSFPNSKDIWRTADGRYEASSFEELLTKMAEDPNSPLTQEEIFNLHSIFDKIIGKPNDEEDEDEDDEDSENEPWKRLQ